MDINELRKKAKAIGPVVRIGKGGITESVIKEIQRQVKRKGMVKIRMLKSFMKGSEKKDAARDLADRSGSMIVEITGFAVVLGKKYKNDG